MELDALAMLEIVAIGLCQVCKLKTAVHFMFIISKQLPFAVSLFVQVSIRLLNLFFYNYNCLRTSFENRYNNQTVYSFF